MSSENLTQDRIITRLIEEIQMDSPSPEEVGTAVDRLRRRLEGHLAPGQAQERPGPGRRGVAEPVRWRRRMLRLGIAAAVVGSVTFWVSMPTGRIGSGVAFAQVLEAARHATSMTYTLIDHADDGAEGIVQVQVHGSRWIRLVGAGRGVRIIDLQDSKMLRFDDPHGPGKSANLTAFAGQAAEALQRACFTLMELNDVLPGDGEPLGNKMIEGHAVTGFRIKRPSLNDDQQDQAVLEIWADAETAQVVRVDMHHERDPATITLVDFNFDVDFEDSLFDLQPPPDYTIVYETIEDIESDD